MTTEFPVAVKVVQWNIQEALSEVYVVAHLPTVATCNHVKQTRTTLLALLQLPITANNINNSSFSKKSALILLVGSQPRYYHTANNGR